MSSFSWLRNVPRYGFAKVGSTMTSSEDVWVPVFCYFEQSCYEYSCTFFFIFLLRANICFRGSGTAARDCAAGWHGGSTSAVPRSGATLPLLTPARRVRAVRCSHVLAAAAAVTVFRFSCPDGRGAGACRDLVRLPLMANDTEYPVACFCGVRLFSLKAAPGACVSRVSLNEFSRVHRTV